MEIFVCVGENEAVKKERKFSFLVLIEQMKKMCGTKRKSKSYGLDGESIKRFINGAAAVHS